MPFRSGKQRFGKKGLSGRTIISLQNNNDNNKKQDNHHTRSEDSKSVPMLDQETAV
jgi:hypothetical protein